jgi:hypothetical protein
MYLFSFLRTGIDFLTALAEETAEIINELPAASALAAEVTKQDDDDHSNSDDD